MPVRVCVLLVLFLNGCYSYRLVYRGDTWNPGDRVRLTLHNGSEHELTIKAKESGAMISTDNRRFDLRNVKGVEVRRFNTELLVILLGSAAGTAGLIAAAIVVGSVASFNPGPT